MGMKQGLMDRRWRPAALALATVALVFCAAAGGASASPPQNAAAYDEVGGLPAITGATTTATCNQCGVDVPRVGDTLTANPGTWSQAPPPSTYSYDWKRCATDGSACESTGATGATYNVAGADVTHVLVVTVTAKNADGAGTATSLPTGIVASANGPVLRATPTLSGLVIVGRQLSISPGVWAPAATSYAVQWQRCNRETSTTTGAGLTVTTVSAAVGCVNVKGATGSTYSVTSADIAHRIRAVVTATTSGGSASAISNVSSLALQATPKKKKK